MKAGFIFVSEDGKYLAENLFWFPHDNPEDAYVHTETSVKEMKARAKRERWETRPAFYIPAAWDGNTVTVKGTKQRM